MSFDSEEEQLEAIKEWLKKNGLPIVLGIVVVLAGTFGWRGWQSHQYQQAAQAAVVYQQMVDGLQRSATNPDDEAAAKVVQANADRLIENWDKSAYADYARLALAKQAVTRNDLDQAADLLQQVAAAPATKDLRHVANLRLVRVYLAAQQLDQAETLLGLSYPEAWQGEQFELTGDLAVQKQDTAAARTAYQQALALLPQSDAAVRVQMKLNQLKADL